MKEEVVSRFILRTEQAVNIIQLLPNVQVISSQELIFGRKPKKEVHSGRDFQGPNSRDMHRDDASKIDDSIEGL